MNATLTTSIISWTVAVGFGLLAYFEYIQYGFHVWMYVYSFISAVAVGMVVTMVFKKKKKMQKKQEKDEITLMYDRIEQLKAEKAAQEKAAQEEAVIFAEPTKEINPVYHKRSKMDFKYWKDKWHEKVAARKVVQINMELVNGFHISMLAVEKEGGFTYRKKQFIFDGDSKYYNMSSKLWCYDFHESFSLPIKRILPVVDIRKTVEAAGVSEVEYATNPSTLGQFVTAKIAEGIMKGQALDEAIRRLLWITIVGAGASIILLLLFAQKTGMFDQVTGSLGV